MSIDLVQDMFDRSWDNDQDEDFYFPNNYHLNRGYRANSLDRYLRNMLVGWS